MSPETRHRPPRTTTYDPVFIIQVLRDAEAMGNPSAANLHGVDRNTLWSWRKKQRDSGGAWPSPEDVRSWHARQRLRAQWRRTRHARIAGSANSLVDATGTQRRLRALFANGWTWEQLGARLGGDKNRAWRLAHDDRQAFRSTVEKVAALYEELSMIRPEGWVAERSRNYARKNGWAPPLAWDNIDDPTAQPAGMDICTRGDCAGPIKALGLCATHYRDNAAAHVDDPVLVDRILAGQWRQPCAPTIKAEVCRRWVAGGRSLAELERLTGWKPERYYRVSAA